MCRSSLDFPLLVFLWKCSIVNAALSSTASTAPCIGWCSLNTRLVTCPEQTTLPLISVAVATMRTCRGVAFGATRPDKWLLLQILGPMLCFGMLAFAGENRPPLGFLQASSSSSLRIAARKNFYRSAAQQDPVHRNLPAAWDADEARTFRSPPVGPQITTTKMRPTMPSLLQMLLGMRTKAPVVTESVTPVAGLSGPMLALALLFGFSIVLFLWYCGIFVR